MKIELFNYICAFCSNRFQAPVFCDPGHYGEFLLRSPSGQLAYLNALESAVYEEVSVMLAQNNSTCNLSELKLAAVLQDVFGEVACDKDKFGRAFSITLPPVCPICGGQNISDLSSSKTPAFVELDLDSVTHEIWSSLNIKEKSDRLNLVLARLELPIG